MDQGLPKDDAQRKECISRAIEAAEEAAETMGACPQHVDIQDKASLVKARPAPLTQRLP